MPVHLKASKSDPLWAGVSIAFGKTDSVLCPIVAMSRYLWASGSKFGHLFIQSAGCLLTRSSFTRKLSSLCSLCGFTGDFTSHSFRIGAPTTASAHGILDSTIQKLGRWSFDPFKVYIRSSPYEIAAFSRILVQKFVSFAEPPLDRRSVTPPQPSISTNGPFVYMQDRDHVQGVPSKEIN